jgi:hypothetical protein
VDKTIVNKLRRETEENSILALNASMERSFIHHKTGEVSIMKLRGFSFPAIPNQAFPYKTRSQVKQQT